MARRSGPPYRRIVVTFWNDPDVKRVLSLEEKAFLAYLFSNEHSHPCGVYRLTPIHVLDELGIDQEQMKELLEGPVAPFATYDWRTDEIFVHNMAEHQIDGGLHGKDNRIRWVVNQLETIHSKGLRRAFRDRYRDWNLPWAELVGADAPPTPENPHSRATKQGASQGASEGPSQAPSDGPESPSDEPESEGSERRPATEPRSKGLTKGLGKPDPDPDPEGGIQPPAYSSGDTLGEDLEESAEAGRQEDESNEEELAHHPALSEQWWPDLHRAVVETWHQGAERIEIHGHSVGMGLEYTLANEIFHELDDPELVRWLIVEAPTAMGWTDEPRSLKWIRTGPKTGGNLEQATAEYHRRHSGRNGSETPDVDVGRAPKRKPDPSELQTEAKRKLAEYAADNPELR